MRSKRLSQTSTPQHCIFSRRPHRGNRRGYVLLAVIAVSVLITTVLSSLAMTSLRRAVSSADAQRRLQQRWGMESLQSAVLSEAPIVFQKRDEQLLANDPKATLPTTIRQVVSLGGVTFDLVLADEDAKLNLNAFYHAVGTRKTQQTVNEMVGPVASQALRLQPAVAAQAAPSSQTSPASPTSPSGQTTRTRSRAARDSDDASQDEPQGPPDAFRSWGEVFDLSRLAIAFGSDAALPNVTTQITCWGSGQSNLRRASDETILAIAGTVMSSSQTQGFLRRYRENPTLSAQILIQTEVREERDRRRLSTMVSQASSNYSMWIDASTPNRRALRRFVVMQRDGEGVTNYRQFAQ